MSYPSNYSEGGPASSAPPARRQPFSVGVEGAGLPRTLHTYRKSGRGTAGGEAT